MDKIKIIGGTPLQGRIPISGAKNAALPLMAACLLSDKPVTLKNMPYLADITLLAQLLHQHGVTCHMPKATCTNRDVRLHAEHITNFTAPYELVRKMRASILVLGPLLARFGEAKVSLPGGCAIGTRPVDLHLKALEALGAEILLEEGYVIAKTPVGGLRGGEIHFDIVSVGATENALMAATLAQGKTIITNAAREPEISDLAQLLVKMGAKIDGIGRSTLEITGVASLGGATHLVLPDRIEAGTYMAAAAITGGDVYLVGMCADDMGVVIEKMEEAGVTITPTDAGLRVQNRGTIMGGLDIITQPHPGFPTDMQAQMMALLALADGASTIKETIFENRFMHVPELQRMGADMTLNGRTATIRGVNALKGAEVMATDLRASSSLIIAALAAKGESVIHRVYHLDRGYECLEEKLRSAGANVERIK